MSQVGPIAGSAWGFDLITRGFDAGVEVVSNRSDKFMPTQPFVSVIVPAYNAESYIDEALRSVLRQTYPHLEVIVVDDGSTDATLQRIAAYQPRVQCIRRSNSGGYPGAVRNTGMEHSRGEYICFLDADDVMAADKVEKQAEFLTDHPDVGLVFTDYRNFSANGPAQLSHFRTCLRLQARLRISRT